MLAGLAAAGLGFLFYKRDRVLFGISLLTLSFMLLLVRGGVVLYFYVIPLLALLALSLGLLAGHVVPVAERWLDERISRWWNRRASSACTSGGLRSIPSLAVLCGTGRSLYSGGR
jgi:hypothetical protein